MPLCVAVAMALALALALARSQRQLASATARGRHGWAFQGAPRASTGCRLDTSASPFERACRKLEDVCLDQGEFILYGKQYQQASWGVVGTAGRGVERARACMPG
jgi:hypothetical protein